MSRNYVVFKMLKELVDEMKYFEDLDALLLNEY